MPARYRKIGTCFGICFGTWLPVALVVSAAIAAAQGTPAAPASDQPQAGNRPAFTFPPPANTALGQKAALMGTLKWGKVP